MSSRSLRPSRSPWGSASLLFAVWLLLSVACDRQAGVDALDAVRSLHAEGRYAESLEPLRGLLDASPEDPQLHHLYARALLETGQPSLAVWSLRRAAEDPERSVEAGLLLARVLLAEHNAPDAAAAADAVLSREPDNPVALSLRGRARILAHREADGISDVDRALEVRPDDVDLHLARVVALVGLGRLDEVEPALDRAEAVAASRSDRLDVEARVCAIRATFAAEKGDVEQARSRFEQCLDDHPMSYLVLSESVQFFDRQKEHARATEAIRNAFERMGEQIAFRLAWTGRLEALGRQEEAERLLLDATRSEPAVPAWVALVDHYNRREMWREAANATQQLMEVTADPPPLLRFNYADLLIEDGDLARGRRLAAELDSPFRELLQGKILLLEGRPGEALEKLEAGTRLWPNNALARFLAGEAAMQLADIDRAMAAYREAVRADPGYTEASLKLAQLHERQGEYESALAVLAPYLDAQPQDVGALEMRFRLARRLGRAELASQTLARLADVPGQAAHAVALNAEALGEGRGAAEAIAWIEQLEIDMTEPGSAPVLRALAVQLARDGRSEEAVALAGRAVAAHPEISAFHEIHGRALLDAGAMDAAHASFSRAVDLDASSRGALLALAELEAERGALETALALCDRVADADPDAAEPRWTAIEILDRADVPDPTLQERLAERLEALLALDPAHARAATRMALLLADRGTDPDRALELARRGVRFGAGPEAWDAVGRAQLQRGEAEAAVAAYRRALARRPDAPSTRYRMGQALAASGKAAEAREAFQTALSSGAFPEAEAARTALAQLEAPAVTPP